MYGGIPSGPGAFRRTARDKERSCSLDGGKGSGAVGACGKFSKSVWSYGRELWRMRWMPLRGGGKMDEAGGTKYAAFILRKKTFVLFRACRRKRRTVSSQQEAVAWGHGRDALH